MTDENATPDPETAAEPEQDSQPKPKPTETVEFWKQKAREQENRAKANAEAAARLKEFEDRDKTESQKLAERATEAEKRLIEAETRALRLEVAAEKGLTPAQAKRLVGGTREELEADAAELLATFTPPAPAAPGFPDLGRKRVPPAGQDFNQILRQAAGRA